MKGIRFGALHSFNDLGLILSSKTIGTPSPKTETISVPGGDGVLDFTEFFGEVKYSNRPLSFNFTSVLPHSQFVEQFATIQNALHGQKMTITLDEDPNWYYIGRLTVPEWKSEKRIGKLTIDCDCEPYRNRLSSKAVNLCGRNLLNLDAGIITDEGVWAKTATGYTFTRRTGTGGTFVYWKLPVKKGQQYTFSATYTETTRLLYVYKDKLYGDLVAKVNNGLPAVFTAEENGIYICGAYATSAATEAVFTNMMIQEGGTVGAYESYDASERTVSASFSNIRKPAVPTAYTSGTVSAETDATLVTLSEGSQALPEFTFRQGENALTFKGNGVTVLEWLERGL